MLMKQKKIKCWFSRTVGGVINNDITSLLFLTWLNFAKAHSGYKVNANTLTYQTHDCGSKTLLHDFAVSGYAKTDGNLRRL